METPRVVDARGRHLGTSVHGYRLRRRCPGVGQNELLREQESLLETGIVFHINPVEEFHFAENLVKCKSGGVALPSPWVCRTNVR